VAAAMAERLTRGRWLQDGTGRERDVNTVLGRRLVVCTRDTSGGHDEEKNRIVRFEKKWHKTNNGGDGDGGER